MKNFKKNFFIHIILNAKDFIFINLIIKVYQVNRFMQSLLIDFINFNFLYFLLIFSI